MIKALCRHGKGDIRCDSVPDPQIGGRDVIIKMSACAICGLGLHLMDGYIPFVEKGDILGHEFMGESSRKAENATKAFGYPTAGLFGYSHLTGAYAGG